MTRADRMVAGASPEGPGASNVYSSNASRSPPGLSASALDAREQAERGTRVLKQVSPDAVSQTVISRKPSGPGYVTETASRRASWSKASWASATFRLRSTETLGRRQVASGLPLAASQSRILPISSPPSVARRRASPLRIAIVAGVMRWADHGKFCTERTRPVPASSVLS